MIKTTIIIFVLFFLAFCGFVVYDLTTAKRRKEVYRVKSSATAYLLLLPSVVLAFLFIMLPILYSLGYAFTDYYLLDPDNIKFILFCFYMCLYLNSCRSIYRSCYRRTNFCLCQRSAF